MEVLRHHDDFTHATSSNYSRDWRSDGLGMPVMMGDTELLVLGGLVTVATGEPFGSLEGLFAVGTPCEKWPMSAFEGKLDASIPSEDTW